MWKMQLTSKKQFDQKLSVKYMYIEMFENFKKFFATKKNLYILIAALVILGGIFLLNKIGLYEGLETQIVSAPTPLPSPPSSAPSVTVPSVTVPSVPPVTAYKKETSTLIMSQNS